MPRVPDMPCAECGKLMWRSSTSLPEGKARCNPCRRERIPPRPTVQHWTCEACDRDCSRPTVRGQVPKWCADCRARSIWKLRRGICAACGEAFEGHGDTFCSRRCARRHVSRRHWSTSTAVQVYVPPVKAKAPPPEPVVRFTAGHCARCGTATITDRFAGYNGLNRYCSRACAKADGRSRRRARKRNAYVADVSRHKIFERDGWRCQLCHHLVDRTAVVPHPKAPTVDHIIPLARGGTHQPSNCQTACFLCNCMKSSHGTGDQLRLIG